MKVPVTTLENKKSGDIELDDSIFGLTPRAGPGPMFRLLRPPDSLQLLQDIRIDLQRRRPSRRRRRDHRRR